MKWSEVSQSCPTLCNPMDCSLLTSSHGIFQARVLEWVDISFSRGSSLARDQTQVSRIAGTHFTVWTLYRLSHILSPVLVVFFSLRKVHPHSISPPNSEVIHVFHLDRMYLYWGLGWCLHSAQTNNSQVILSHWKCKLQVKLENLFWLCLYFWFHLGKIQICILHF